MTHFLALSGSFRNDSLNTAVLRSIQRSLAPKTELRIHDYREVPLYNSDLDRPASVDTLIEAINSAAGVIIATPEYNYSIPGVLKNALDWASRPAYQSVLSNKPFAILSASMSTLGGVRAQQHLKTVLLGVGSHVFPYPEVAVAQAHQKMKDGELQDEATIEHLQKFARAFETYAKRVAG